MSEGIEYWSGRLVFWADYLDKSLRHNEDKGVIYTGIGEIQRVLDNVKADLVEYLASRNDPLITAIDPDASPPPAPKAVASIPRAPQEPEQDYDDDDFCF